MTLKDLKTTIEQNNPIEELIIFNCPDSDFIVHQYINKISDYTDSNIISLESLDDYTNNSSFFVTDNIYIYKCDNLDIKTERFKKASDLFIICKKISKETLKLYKDYIIDIPKLETWQIIDYLAYNCPTVYNEFVPYIDKMDIYALDNEMKKVSIFSKNKIDIKNATFDEKELPKYVIKALNDDKSWSYLPKYTVFDFVQALLIQDKKTVNSILNTDMELPLAAICQLLYQKIKEIISVIYDPTTTADSLNMSSSKYWAIKNAYKNLPLDFLTKALKFIIGIDKCVKTGWLVYDDEKLFDILIIFFLKDNNLEVNII